MRNSSQILVFIDVQKALEAGIKFYLSDNGVVLTEGDEQGFLKPDFFSRVETADRKPLPGWDGPEGISKQALEQESSSNTSADGSTQPNKGAAGTMGADMKGEAVQAASLVTEEDVQDVAGRLETTAL